MRSHPCPHDDVEPVEVRDRTTGKTIVVGNICRQCLDRLPAQWGCPDCEWVDIRSLADTAPRLVPGMPCKRHTLAAAYG